MHLGRRPSRLPEDAPPDVDPRAGWKAVVETALERRVDAVLLAGDVVESRNGFMEAYGALRQGVTRLHQRGIDVIAVAGNHDVEVLPRLADELEHFHLLGRGGRWESLVVRRAGEPVVRVLGWSFPDRRYESSPLDSMSEAQRLHRFDDGAADELRTVGLLHCDLDASAGSYAPVSRASLANLPISAFFLGHIHAPSIKPESRPIGYLGSLVALDPGEQGAHGPWLAESLPGGWQLEQLELSPLRWETLELDISGCRDSEAIQSELLRAAGELHTRIASAGLRVVGLRPRLVGETRLALADVQQALQAARELGSERRDDILYFFDKGSDDTWPALDLALLARGSDPAALLARRLLALQEHGPESRQLVREARERLLIAATHGNFQALGVPVLEEDDVRARLLRSARRALRELLAQKPGAAEGATTSVPSNAPTNAEVGA